MIEPLRDGSLCITTLAELTKIMNESNCEELLAEALGKPRREVKRIVAREKPQHVPNDTRRSLQPAQVNSECATPAPQPSLGSASDQPVESRILTESLARLYLTVDREYDELLERVRSALSHKMPGAAVLDLIKEGFRRIIRDDEKRKGIVDKPRADRVADDGTISQSVKRTVQKRDQGKCQWRSEDGGICGSTYRVEFHHIQDRAKGGLGTPENIIQLCEKHHLLATEIAWGEERIAKYRKQPSATEDLQSQLDFR